MLVMKFGGTSLGTAGNIRRAFGIIRSSLDRNPVVVVSAFSGVTDSLIRSAENAARGEVSVDGIRERHFEVVKALSLDHGMLEPELGELENFLWAISYVKKVLPELYAAVVSFGERMSSKVIAAYASSQGLPAVAVNAFDAGLVTDSNYREAEVLPESYGGLAKAISAFDGKVPVITGFIAKDGEGMITTLGRGGSDYTASVVAAAIGADEVQIWTDVDGMMTADPRDVPSARTVPRLCFSEASELAFFGAKVLHPKTILPAVSKSIPVRVLNTLSPDAEGTVIVSEVSDENLVTAVACKHNVSVVNISSPRMLFASGFLDRIFGVFSAHGISVDIVSTSEVSVSLTLDSKYDLSAVIPDLEALGSVEVLKGRASISVVGHSMRHTPGIPGVIFGCLREAAINTEMISLGASEINLSFVVEEGDALRALQLLHRAFFEDGQIIKTGGLSQLRGVM